MSKFSSLAILSCKYRHIYANRLLTQYSLLKGPKILMKYHNLHFYIDLEGKNTPTIFLYMHLYPCLRVGNACWKLKSMYLKKVWWYLTDTKKFGIQDSNSLRWRGNYRRPPPTWKRLLFHSVTVSLHSTFDSTCRLEFLR